MNKPIARLFYLLRLLGDIAIVHLAFYLGHLIYISQYPFHHHFLEKNLWEDIYYLPSSQYCYVTLALVASLFLTLYNVLRKYYRSDNSLLHVKEYQHIVSSYFFAALATCTAYFLFYIYLKNDSGSAFVDKLFSRRIFGYSFAISLFLVVVYRAILNKLAQKLHQAGVIGVNCLILGAGRNGALVGRRLHNRPEYHCRPVGFLDDFVAGDTSVALEKGGQTLPVLGTLEDLESVIDRRKVGAVFFCVTECPEEKIFRALDICCQKGVRFYFTPRLYLMPQVITSQQISGITVLSVVNDFGASLFYTVSKRLCDLLITLAVLVPALPVMLAVALAIRLDSRGPVLFKQERIGLKGRPFVMYKFRTMFAEFGGSELKPKTGSDSRITRVGRFLRLTSLDELPQLFNVLKGDMSIVGPRPEMTFIVDQYDRWQRLRLEVVPGITGLWQISADRNLPIHENLDYDIYYLQERSLLLDLVIIFKTFLFVARGI